MGDKEYASLYAVAKICGFDNSFDDFKKLYDQYYSETVNSLPEPDLTKVEAVSNPFRTRR